MQSNFPSNTSRVRNPITPDFSRQHTAVAATTDLPLFLKCSYRTRFRQGSIKVYKAANYAVMDVLPVCSYEIPGADNHRCWGSLSQSQSISTLA
jgi:hypothetical protein